MTAGDRVVGGEPGSGKSYLLAWLARHENLGLFVRPSASDAEIADDLRERQPKVVFVDDAHVHLALLERVRQVREAPVGGLRAGPRAALDFGIVATSWTSRIEPVRQALAITSESHVRRLELLTREEIRRVYAALGVAPSAGVLRELIDQASNRPGLAVMLADAYRRGDYEGLGTGEALHRALMFDLETQVDNDVGPVAACFGLGGDRGMPWPSVAHALGREVLEIRRIAAELGSAGVLRESGSDRLSVWPRQLRAPLVRRAFFAGALSLPFQDLLDNAPDRNEAVLEILRARYRGAAVPDNVLLSLVSESRDPGVWRAYAGLGASEVAWVIEHLDPDLVAIAGPALEHAPTLAVGRLLSAAHRAHLGEHQAPHPMQHLATWTWRMAGGPSAALERRRLLCDVVNSLESDAVSPPVRLWALCLALSPALVGGESDPAAGRRVTIRYGIFPGDAAQHFLDLVDRSQRTFRSSFDSSDPEAWTRVKNLVNQWASPSNLTTGRASVTRTRKPSETWRRA
jgi:hypothetical protein